MKWSAVMTTFLSMLLAVVVLTQDRVLFRDVTALTFRAGAKTKGRRSPSIPQLQCQGRVCRQFKPTVVQCIQTGWDGRDATWRCESDLPSNLRFGDVAVNCEGYSYPNDAYILAGSCGLKYQLVDTAPAHDDDQDVIWPRLILMFIVVAIIVSIALSKCCKRSRFSSDDDGPPPPPYGDYYRMPGFSRPAAPNNCGPGFNSSSSSAQAPSGPGFFTGLGLGGLAGYAFGNRNRRNNIYTAPAYEHPRSRSSGWGWGSSPASSSESSAAPTRTTTGYATTERR